MKKFQIAGLAALSILGSMTAVQAQATTEPVGYVTETIKDGAFNIIGLTLHESPVVSGSFETISGNDVTDSDVDFASTLATNTIYILEITSGSAEGELQFFTTDDVATNTITASDNLETLGVASGHSYSIRPAATLASIFGADNTAGLEGNATVASADQVWVLGDSGFTKYYYNTNPFNSSLNSWKLVDGGTNVDANTIPLYYSDAIYISAATTGSDRNITITGSVKSAKTTHLLETGFNYIGVTNPVGSTLHNSDLQNQIVGDATQAGADIVYIPDGTGSFTKYYYNTNPFNSSLNAWKNADTGVTVDATTINLPSAIIVQRKSSSTNLTITPSF